MVLPYAGDQQHDVPVQLRPEDLAAGGAGYLAVGWTGLIFGRGPLAGKERIPVYQQRDLVVGIRAGDQLHRTDLAIGPFFPFQPDIDAGNGAQSGLNNDWVQWVYRSVMDNLDKWRLGVKAGTIPAKIKDGSVGLRISEKR